MNDFFSDERVNLDALKAKAFNYRWAEVPEGVIPLTAADPDFPVAPEIRQAMSDYIADGYFSYAPKLGYPSLAQALVEAVERRKGERIPPDLVLPVDSAARGMYTIAKAFMGPGDEMIVFNPCDFLFRESCLASGATPVYYDAPLDVERREMDLSGLEALVTPRTKMIGLCNPHNPYGLVYTPEQLENLMALCERHDLLVMNDEIWSDIVYPDAQFRSIYSLGNDRCSRVLSVFGFSKSFGLAGLRIGCAYCTDPKKFERIVAASDVMSTAGGASSLSMVAAEAALSRSYYWVDAFLEHLVANRDFAVERINAMPHLHAYRPQATYLLYVDIRELGMTGEEFVDYIEGDVGLALIPGGEGFFGSKSEGHVRICFATSRAVLEESMNRLARGVDDLCVERGI